MTKTENFEQFLNTWNDLPRSVHAILPAIRDCTPRTMGELLTQSAIFKYEGKHQLRLHFVGTEMERLSGITGSGSNYYDLIAADFKPLMHAYHKTVFGYPCGAYIGDVITTRSGVTYLFETMQFPVSDNDGNANYLLAYGYGRTPAGNLDGRDVSDRRGQHIRDLHYMDLGAGAPSNCIINFEARP